MAWTAKWQPRGNYGWTTSEHPEGNVQVPSSGGLSPLVDPSLEVGASVVGAPLRGGCLVLCFRIPTQVGPTANRALVGPSIVE